MALLETMNEVSIFILAGGLSSRMGRDKALITYEGVPLVQRALGACAAISSAIWIVGESSKFSKFGPTIEDIHSGCGPLGGIHAALTKSQAEMNLILAVDMPYVSSELLRFLLTAAKVGDATVTIPKVDMRLQPLCAVYRRGFLPVVETAIARKAYKITPLFQQVQTRVIPSEELQAAGFSFEMFKNWNSPADLEAACKIETS